MAESSVTIPGVAYVIDSCRSLQVYWNPVRRIDSVKLVWISKSQVNITKILMLFILNLLLTLKFDTSYNFSRLSSGKAGQAGPVMVKFFAW
jgi:hypothetical protein